ncbi:hypothetical protein [Halarcobacter ebronensis]|nr:hypothetical protein [Halarcobacter ebronensis]
MNKIVLLIVFSMIMMSFSGCTSFRDEYKPLYQVKPEIEDIKRTK